jgi:tRNA pseudouridine38-40 synthase
VAKLNRFVGNNILIYDCFPVTADCHARFSALFRTYYYYIALQKVPFQQEFVYQLFRAVNFDLMNNAAALLAEYSDFSAFSKSHTQTLTNRCHVMKAQWEPTNETDIWVFKITADRFLRNMVRAIVGTVLEVGYGKISIDEFKAIIESKERCKAGLSAPASALFLVDVGYNENMFLK